MNNKISLALLVAAMIAPSSYANLVDLNQDEMTQTLGQGAAELSWTLSLNHQYANDLNLSNISKLNKSGAVEQVYYNYVCVDNISCRMAIAANNHEDENGNKKWLVFKQFQGTVQIDKFTLEGTTIKNQFDKPQTALNIKFEDQNPLKIRNLGFASLAVETGENGREGFTNYKTYSDFKVKNDQGQDVLVQVPGFDQGQEQGFMGLNVHGNLHMNGSLKIFSYNCSGAAGSRC